MEDLRDERGKESISFNMEMENQKPELFINPSTHRKTYRKY